MPRTVSIEGFVIVSADGMLADSTGVMPPSLMHDADQKFFFGALARAAVVVHGRHSGEQDPGAATRKRLKVTHAVAALAPDPANAKALFWNPDGASIDEALRALDVDRGLAAVIGGGNVFDLFLHIGYDAFHLSRAGNVRLPGGRLAFPGDPQQTPEQALAGAGLKPGPLQVLDAASDITLVTWTR
jgi:hypothetical protein